MPPLEQFMVVSFEERRNLLYRDMERGDIVIGRINSIRDFGFFVTLICMAGGLERDIEDLELTVRLVALAWWSVFFFIEEIGAHGNLVLCFLSLLRPCVPLEMYLPMAIMMIRYHTISLMI